MLSCMVREFDYKAAARFQKERILQKNEALSFKLEKARADFAAIAAMIIDKYGPSAVYQWGSLINGRHFSEISDIDIAVEGIQSAKDFFALLGDAMALTDFPVDIVQLEKIEPEFRNQIIQKGRKVYAKP